jgi:hypothetical protein
MSKAYNRFPDESPDDPYECTPVNDNEPTCRICFEAQADDNLLITPCKCIGSVKYIHEECLKVWLISKQTDLKTVTCELCMAKFVMKFKFELKFAPCSDCDENIAHWFFLPLLVSVFTMLVLIICVIIARIDIVKEEKKFTVILLATCFVSCLMIVYLFVNSIKEAVFVEELCEWHIISNTPPEPDLDKHVLNETSMVPPPPTKEFIPAPSKIRIGSRSIRAPVVTSHSLSAVERDGKVVGYTARLYTYQMSHEAEVAEEMSWSARRATPVKFTE